MIKKWVILTCTLCAALLFLFREPIANTALRIYLERQSHAMETPLTYAGIESSGNTLTFLKPVIDLKNGRFEAEKLTLSYDFQILRRHLNLKIFLDNPNVCIEKEGSIDKILSQWLSSSSFIDVEGEVHCREGSISLNHLDDPKELLFNFNHSWGKKHEGVYFLAFGEEEKASHMDFSFKAEDSENFDLKANLQHVDAKQLAQALKAFFPELASWEFQQGLLDGEFALRFENAKLANGQGELKVDNLKVEQPQLGLSGFLEKALFRADSQSSDAVFEILKGGSLFFKDEETYAKFREFKGLIAIRDSENLELSLNGLWEDKESPIETKLQGNLHLPDWTDLSLKILLHPQGKPEKPSFISIKTKKLENDTAFAAIELHQFGPKQFHFWQRSLENLFPGWNPISYHNGTVDAFIKVAFHPQALKELKIENISAENAFFVVKPWEVALGADKISGNLSVDLENPSPRDTLNADLQVKNGQLSLIGLHFDFWNFTHIETNLSIKKGLIQKSSASVELAGLKGSAEINFLNRNEILRLHLQGKAVDLKPFLPLRIQNGIDKQMSEDELLVEASVAQKYSGFKINGELKVKAPQFELPSPLVFGFELEKSLFDSTKPKEKAFLRYWQEIAPAAAQMLSPPPLKTLSALESRWMLQELGIQGFVMRNGWFTVSGLPLEKFISPFLFNEDQLFLKGTSQIDGHFDHQGLSINYGGKQVILENDKLCIDVKEVSSTAEASILPATHYVDFARGKHFGELPIENGSYFDKNSGLLFTDLNGLVIFEGEKIHILDLEAFSNGIYFAGTVDIDYSSPLKGVFDLEIQVQNLHGKFSEIQHFFSHFEEPFYFLNIPLEGDIALGEKGAKLLFAFQPDDYDFKGNFEGSLSDGVLDAANLELSMQELFLNFAYDHEKNILDFSDLQGTLLMGKPSCVEEYTLSSESIHFSDYRHNKAKFDIRISDRNRDLIRLAGETLPSKESTGDQEIAFSFDPAQTSFLGIHPQEIDFELINWTKIEKAKLAFNFRLSSLLYDLQKFSKTGLPFISGTVLKELGSLKNAGGEFSALMQYDGASSKIGFNIQGADVTFGDHQFKNIYLAGHKRDKTWTIDQLQFGQISIAAELTKDDELWKANFLGLRYGQSLLLGLEGEYREGQEAIKARINLLEADLSKLHEWPDLLPFVEEYHPIGLAKATGSLLIEPPSNGRGWNFDGTLDASLRSFTLNDLHFADCEHISCHFVTDRGVTLRQVSAGLKPERQSAENPTFFLDKLDYDFATNQLLLEGLNFSIPSNHLGWISKELAASFPDAVSSDAADLLKGLKSTGKLEGTLHLRKSSPDHQLHLYLADGIYNLWGKEHDLRSFSLNLDSEELKVAAQYRLNQHLFWLTARSNPANMDRGELILADESSEAAPEYTPLVITWKRDEQRGVSIQKAKGFFGSMHIDLMENEERPSTPSSYHLIGEISMLHDGYRNLLDAEISSQLAKWQVGKGYRLQGSFEIGKDIIDNERDIRFFGTLSGEDFELKGYRFKQLSSHIAYTPHSVQISEITINDPAGALYIEQANVSKKGNIHCLSIPLLTIQELRPSLLYELAEPPSGMKKPLVIRELYVQNLSGMLGNENSFAGSGSLYFNNPVKKHLQNTIFAIPAEILTRIGLDLSILTPVTGTIQYQIQDGKVYLTKFKDIYSHSRLSKFYLPNSSYPSYVDFDGNLNIQVRMKQYTLLFKLAEMFTVTIKGDLKKPTYTLRKQKPLQRAQIVSTEDY